MSKLRGIVSECRPKQWYKQLLLIVPIVLSAGHFFNIYSWLDVILGVVAFCFVCSGVYIFNDINDVEEDRQHPVKRQRPIASGLIGLKEGFIYACILFFGGLIISYYVDTLFFLLVLTYVIQNIFYSIELKNIYLIDVFIIAIGMVIRLLSGYIIIDEKVNYWVVVVVFIAAFYLAISKRIGELELDSSGRKVFEYYDKDQLYRIYNASQASLIVIYTIFSLNSHSNYIILTLLFAIYSVFRYDYLLNNSYIKDTPSKMFTDKPFFFNLILWVLTLVIILHSEIIRNLTTMLYSL